MAMGLEFLFAPVTILVFVSIVVGGVLLQRFFFRRAFEALGSKKVMTAYATVLAFSLVLGTFFGGGALRESATNGLLACYISLIFVTIGLLPLSLLLARRWKASAAAVVGAGVFLSILIGLGMVWAVGLDRVLARGAGWLYGQASALGFLAAVSVAFAVGLTTRRR
jgi:hypothetical protein